MILIKVVTPAQMQALERYSFDNGCSSREAMRRAGEAVARVILTDKQAKSVLVVCGGGNNGGDGFVCADILYHEGVQVEILFVGDEKKQSLDAHHFFEIIKHLIIQSVKEQYDCVVDALFGIGFKGAAQGKAAETIALINGFHQRGAKVLAVDVPSGLNPHNGLAQGDAVRADITVTFEYSKTGHLLGDGPDFCGKIEIVKIGLLEGDTRFVYAPEISDIQALFPKRKHNTHKGTYGHVGILAGSKGMEGAGALAALAALRSGVGKVSLAVPECCMDFYNNRALEVMCQGLPFTDGHFTADFTAIDAFLQDKDAIVFGMGIGRNIEMSLILKHILKSCTVPLIIDADGLYYLDEKLLSELKNKKVILTPHLGEMARIFDVQTTEIEMEPLLFAEKASEASQNTILLKSAYNVIASPENTWISLWGCAGMATAGSGDVLAGILGALACNMPADKAALAGAYLHGSAGKMAAVAQSEVAMIASDIAAFLPDAFCHLIG